MVFSEDPCTGELTGAVTFSFLGKGAGLAIHEQGTATGHQGALQ